MNNTVLPQYIRPPQTLSYIQHTHLQLVPEGLHVGVVLGAEGGEVLLGLGQALAARVHAPGEHVDFLQEKTIDTL